MKILLPLLCLALSGCTLLPVPSTPAVVAPTGTATAAQLAALSKQNDELKGQIADQNRLATNAAGAVYGAKNANQANPEGLPKEAVSSNLEEAESALPSVSAEEKLRRERDNARILAGELATVKAERGQAISENQQLRAKVSAAETRLAELEREVAKTKAAGEKERAEAAAKLQRAFDEMEKRVAAADQRAADAVDEVKKSALQRLGYVLLGLGVLFTLIGAFQTYAIVQTGLLSPGNFLKPLVWAGSAGFCFACYWTLNQPWFKWLVFGGAGAGAIAVGLFLYAEWAEAKKRREGLVRSAEADEAESALLRIINVVDGLSEDTSLAEMKKKLSNRMDDAHKALVHELRAEAKRTAG